MDGRHPPPSYQGGRVTYPSESEMDRADDAAISEGEAPPVTQTPRRLREHHLPWLYPDYTTMLAEVAEEYDQ